MDDYEENPPRADAMIASLRAMGYDLPMAIADLIDNSITAKATEIKVEYSWNGPDSWIKIIDNGSGISGERLKEAMRLGSQSPLEIRDPDDLGRFGMGLKTASFSQCKLLVVSSKTAAGSTSTRFWDLDHVIDTKKWEMGKKPSPNIEILLKPLDDMEQGTIVFWSKLDRVVNKNENKDDEEQRDVFFKKFLSVKKYLEMVFHRYLSPPNPITIYVGLEKLEPWDPYLISNPFTQRLPVEKYDESSVEAHPFVLPHVSHRSNKETEEGAGLKGWNAQQGFYVYRNKRMIVPGGYLDLNIKQEEHYKLARISIDMMNQADYDWSIDVRKATACPPEWLRSEMLKIARATRERAVKIYRARTGTPKIIGRTSSAYDVWVRKRSGEKVIYQINRKNEIISKILSEIEAPEKKIKQLFQVIETTIPHRRIIMDNAEVEDCHVNLSPEIWKPNKELLEICKEYYYNFRDDGKDHNTAVSIVLSMDPFNTHPAFRALLDGLIEGGRNNE